MTLSKVDFANILFAGPCNRRCPDCIGQQLPAKVNRSNLDEFPPQNITGFIQTVNRLDIRRIIFTATNTDPQLYCCEIALLDMLRENRIDDVRSLLKHVLGNRIDPDTLLG